MYFCSNYKENEYRKENNLPGIYFEVITKAVSFYKHSVRFVDVLDVVMPEDASLLGEDWSVNKKDLNDYYNFYKIDETEYPEYYL